MIKSNVSVANGVMELMAILGDAPMKVDPKAGAVIIAATEAAAKVKAEVIKEAAQTGQAMETIAYKKLEKAMKAAPEYVYEHGRAIEINGRKVTTGPKKKGAKRSTKNDAVKNAIKDFYTDVINSTFPYNTNTFEHSSEGLVIRLGDADYTLKVSKSKENKFDVNAEDFEVTKDFSVRGKAKNSAPGIAKTLFTNLEIELAKATAGSETESQNSNSGIEIEISKSISEMGFQIVQAKSSGIVIQGPKGEYTIKISKKRDRVAFEAENAKAYK